MNTNVSWEALDENAEFTVAQWCAMTSLTQVYVRKQIKAGKLVGRMVQFNGTQFKRLISVSEWKKFRNDISTPNKREDGRSRFVLHANAKELEAIRQLLDDKGLNFEVSKQKQYNKKS